VDVGTGWVNWVLKSLNWLLSVDPLANVAKVVVGGGLLVPPPGEEVSPNTSPDGVVDPVLPLVDPLVLPLVEPDVLPLVEPEVLPLVEPPLLLPEMTVVGGELPPPPPHAARINTLAATDSRAAAQILLFMTPTRPLRGQRSVDLTKSAKLQIVPFKISVNLK